MRVKGGVYLTTDLSRHGRPLEDFILDPPIELPLDQLGITPRGVTLLETNGVWNVYDYVGEESYPNVADFVEEVRRLGLSRRINRNQFITLADGTTESAFALLTPESSIILIHKRAMIRNHAKMRETLQMRGGLPVLGPLHICPKSIDLHDAERPLCDGEMCAGLWWHDVDDSSPDGDREMPAFTYKSRSRLLPEMFAPDYAPAAFLSLPINRLALIHDPDHGAHLPAAEILSRYSNLPVDVEES